MAFDGTEGGQITLSQAATMTAAYRNANSGSGTVLAHFFGRDIISDILTQTGCKGIRFYHGLDSANKPQLIMVGVDANQNDMTSGIIGDISVPCPTKCGNTNALNS